MDLSGCRAHPAGRGRTRIAPSGSSNPEDLISIGTTLYFGADDGTHGQELWKRVP